MTTTIKIGVILVYVGLITAIALYCGRGNKTFKDFAIGGAKIPWFIMAGTLFSTFCGGATMVAYVGNFYSQGMIDPAFTFGAAGGGPPRDLWGRSIRAWVMKRLQAR